MTTPTPRKAFFIGYNALGDTLCTTPVVRAYRRCHGDTWITYICQDVEYCRVLDANPDIDEVIYSEKLYLEGLGNGVQQWIYRLALDIAEPAPLFHFDIHRAATAEAFHDHLARAFASMLEIPIDSVRPVIKLRDVDRRRALIHTPHSYVVFNMHSYSNIPRNPGGPGCKQWHRPNWWALASRIRRHYGLDVIAVGSERDGQDTCPAMRNLYGLPILTVAALLENAQCVVTLENGLGHLAAAVDASTVILYSDIVPREWAYPEETKQCRVLYGDPQQFELAQVQEAVDSVLSAPCSRDHSSTSCRPDAGIRE